MEPTSEKPYLIPISKSADVAAFMRDLSMPYLVRIGDHYYIASDDPMRKNFEQSSR